MNLEANVCHAGAMFLIETLLEWSVNFAVVALSYGNYKVVMPYRMELVDTFAQARRMFPPDAGDSALASLLEE